MFLGKDHKITESFCPYCDYKMDGCTGVSHDDQPSVGDVTICCSCAQVLVFGDGLILREPTKEESQQFSQHKELMTMQKIIKDVDRSKINAKR